jgi:hypothetical protein
MISIGDGSGAGSSGRLTMSEGAIAGHQLSVHAARVARA